MRRPSLQFRTDLAEGDLAALHVDDRGARRLSAPRRHLPDRLDETGLADPSVLRAERCAVVEGGGDDESIGRVSDAGRHGARFPGDVDFNRQKNRSRSLER